MQSIRYLLLAATVICGSIGLGDQTSVRAEPAGPVLTVTVAYPFVDPSLT